MLGTVYYCMLRFIYHYLRFCQCSSVQLMFVWGEEKKKAPAIGRSDVFTLNQTKDVTMPVTQRDVLLIFSKFLFETSWPHLSIELFKWKGGKKTAGTLEKP